MKMQVTFEDFVNAFRRHGRVYQFSRDALEALFDYYEQLEEDTGEEMTLDVVAICCDWTEYTLDEAIEAYDLCKGIEVKNLTAAEKRDAVRDELACNTTVLPVNADSVLVLNF